MRTRSRWLILTLAGVGVAAAMLSVAARIPFSSDILRRRVVDSLSTQLDADVELGALTLQLFPRPHVTGDGLRLRFEHRHDVPPLVAIDRFSVDADFIGLWRRRVAHVTLSGLAINIPPGAPDVPDAPPTREAPEARGAPGAPGAPAETASRQTPPTASGPEATPALSRADDIVRSVIIEQLDAPDSSLTILRRDPDKPARVWRMHSLTLRQVGLASRMPFETVLTNAVPPGEVTASGTFGPWQRTDPGATALSGQFLFEKADLSVFNGISGILTARGGFSGSLDRLVVDGRTESPDFMVRISGHPVPLTATYRAVVDATNGNTTLDPVDAHVLDTRITARGGVLEMEGAPGRTVTLDVTIEGGRLEDVMRLAVNADRAPMTGGLSLTTKMTIPPGPKDVVEKLALDGQFTIDDGRFTDRGVQAKINELSRRASGQKPTTGAADPRVNSDFAGRFVLRDARLSLSHLTFNVPGALVSMGGAYSLRRETLAFRGELLMDAKLSQTTTGFKSLLLKLADPFFRRNGRTFVPLRIHGTRSNPQFGLDVGRVFRR